MINVLLYITVWISGLYSFTFGTYSRVGLASPPFWHAAMAWAHFGMAVTLWFMPQFGHRMWPVLGRTGRLAAVAVGGVILLTPSVFAQYQAVMWEFPFQETIDRATLGRPELVALKEGPLRVEVGTDARYGFTLRFGPRSYRNWFKQTRALDAGQIHVDGRLWRDGQIIAWCAASVERLPTPNTIILPVEFPATMKSMEFTDIPVPCSGPSAMAKYVNSGSPVTVDWSATMTLIAYRTHLVKTFTGKQEMPPLVKTPPNV